MSDWPADDHARALDVFRGTLAALESPAWQALSDAAARVEVSRARAFFEHWFEPTLIGDPSDALITGYFEPELRASRIRTTRYPVPLYAPPAELSASDRWASRAEIEDQNLLAGRGLEIAWVESELDRFFLQVQGSGRLRFAEGGDLRLGYDGKNGHPYRSVGKELVRRGVVPESEITADDIRRVYTADPEAGRRLLQHNPSFVFFRVLPNLSPDEGPLGTLGHPVTAGRTLAVDPEFIPLGAPVWVETDGARPMRRLLVAQDTGSAITGPQRADVFIGTGDAAGGIAGAMRDPGRIITLLPKGAPARVPL
ncbi:MAG: murein transglycosylase A [Pseudomonadota bacterium]